MRSRFAAAAQAAVLKKEWRSLPLLFEQQTTERRPLSTVNHKQLKTWAVQDVR